MTESENIEPAVQAALELSKPAFEAYLAAPDSFEMVEGVQLYSEHQLIGILSFEIIHGEHALRDNTNFIAISKRVRKIGSIVAKENKVRVQRGRRQDILYSRPDIELIYRTLVVQLVGAGLTRHLSQTYTPVTVRRHNAVLLGGHHTKRHFPQQPKTHTRVRFTLEEQQQKMDFPDLCTLDWLIEQHPEQPALRAVVLAFLNDTNNHVRDGEAVWYRVLYLRKIFNHETAQEVFEHRKRTIGTVLPDRLKSGLKRQDVTKRYGYYICTEEVVYAIMHAILTYAQLREVEVQLRFGHERDIH